MEEETKVEAEPVAEQVPKAITAVGTGGALVACDPKELARAQQGLTAWARAMQTDIAAEVEELKRSLEVAEKNRWGVKTTLRNQLRRAEKRGDFYAKIEAALLEGYLVVPNFNMDIFAIRTAAGSPRGDWHTWSHPTSHQQVAQLLPQDEGENQSPVPVLAHKAERYTDKQGQVQVRDLYRPDAFRDVDFPIEVAKPVVMETTAKALRLRLFDEIGIAKDSRAIRRGDPMILGRLRNPRPNHPDVTFFIAWHFDPSNV